MDYEWERGRIAQAALAKAGGSGAAVRSLAAAGLRGLPGGNPSLVQPGLEDGCNDEVLTRDVLRFAKSCGAERHPTAADRQAVGFTSPDPVTGTELIALKAIKRGEIVCYYGGHLVEGTSSRLNDMRLLSRTHTIGMVGHGSLGQAEERSKIQNYSDRSIVFDSYLDGREICGLISRIAVRTTRKSSDILSHMIRISGAMCNSCGEDQVSKIFYTVLLTVIKRC
jgi:hypothetical protein